HRSRKSKALPVTLLSLSPGTPHHALSRALARSRLEAVGSRRVWRQVSPQSDWMGGLDADGHGLLSSLTAHQAASGRTSARHPVEPSGGSGCRSTVSGGALVKGATSIEATPCGVCSYLASSRAEVTRS